MDQINTYVELCFKPTLQNLIRAIREKNTLVIDLFIDNYTINKVFRRAIEHASLDSIKFLQEKYSIDTALYINEASLRCDYDIFMFCMQKGQVILTDDNYRTFFIRACEKESMELVKLFLVRVDKHWKTSGLRTLIAKSTNPMAIAKVLIDAGAEGGYSDEDGEYVRNVRPDSEIEDYVKNHNALDLAYQGGNYELLEYMLDHCHLRDDDFMGLAVYFNDDNLHIVEKIIRHPQFRAINIYGNKFSDTQVEVVKLLISIFDPTAINNSMLLKTDSQAIVDVLLSDARVRDSLPETALRLASDSRYDRLAKILKFDFVDPNPAFERCLDTCASLPSKRKRFFKNWMNDPRITPSNKTRALAAIQ
jgi:hypothetical protein